MNGADRDMTEWIRSTEQAPPKDGPFDRCLGENLMGEGY